MLQDTTHEIGSAALRSRFSLVRPLSETVLSLPCDMLEAMQCTPESTFRTLAAVMEVLQTRLGQQLVGGRTPGIRNYQPTSALCVCFASTLNNEGELHMHMMVIFSPTRLRQRKRSYYEKPDRLCDNRTHPKGRIRAKKGDRCLS